MYLNISIEEGLEAFKEELDKREDKTIPTEFILKLLKPVLESNIFEFRRQASKYLRMALPLNMLCRPHILVYIF